MRSNKSTAHWSGPLKEGKGTLSSQSRSLSSARYDYASRFENGVHTNPEELIAAAHAGCFSMYLSGQLEKEGATIQSIDTSATVSIDKDISSSKIETSVRATGVDQEKFKELAEYSKENCPVSRLLNCEITLDAKLEDNVGEVSS